MTTSKNHGYQTIALIQGGGEMGELTRTYPWANTPLGTAEQWPLSLRTLVNMMLSSRFPMLIFWGPDLITFYNDAFRPSLGNEGKHPSSLGQRGEESWAESWPVIGPMIYNIMAGGDAVWFEDQKLPIYREGTMGYAYWTYSFSPVTDDDGKVNGVLVTCTETTKAVEAIENLAKSEGQFKNLVRETATGIAVMMGPQFRIEIVNEAFAQLVGRTAEELLGKNEFDVIPEAEAAFRPIMEKAMHHSEPTYLNNTPYTLFDERGEKIEGIVNITYQPYKEADGEVTGLIVLCQDVTIAEKAQQQIKENEQRLLASFNHFTVGLAIIGGEDLTFHMANSFYCFLYGRTQQQLVGKSLLEAMPELAGAGFDKLLTEVFATGLPYSAKEIAVQVQRHGQLDTIYIDHTYQPQYDAMGNVVSVLALVIDVTRQVLSRRQIEQVKQTIDFAVEAGDLGYFTVDLATGLATCSQKIIDWFGLPAETLPAEEVISKVYEEDREKSNALFQASLAGDNGGKHDIVYRMLSAKTGELLYLRSIGQVQYQDGKGVSVSGIIQNTTDEVYATKNLKDSEERFRSLMEQAPVASCLFIGREMRIEIANNLMLDVWGKGKDVLDKPLAEALPEMQGQPFLQILDDVFTTGKTYAANGARADLVIEGKLQTFYFDFTYKPIFNAQGQVYGVMDMAVDVTEQVVAQQKIERSQQDLLALFEQSPVAIATIAKDGMTFRMVNPFYAALVGRTTAELIDKPLLEALPELAGQGFDDLLQHVIDTGVPYLAQEVAVEILRNGKLEVIYVNLTYQPRLEINRNEVAGVLVVATDVTEQVNARKKIERGEENLRIAINAAALATFSVDIENRQLNASPRLKEIFGYGVDEEMPYEAAAVQIREDYRQMVLNGVEAAIVDGVPFDKEYPVIGYNDGKTRWVRGVATVQTLNDGKSYYTGIINDITEKKLDEIRKNDFIGMVSHELKTPLTSMSGYLQFLQVKAKRNEDTFTTGILEKANKQIGKMTTMINGFLNVSRLESGKIHIDKTRFDMADLVREAEEEVIASINSHQVVFAPVEPTFVLADRDKIGHVISNLISNAIKYSPATSLVNVACITREGMAILSVRDEGIGIKPEDVPKLFDRYYRVGSDSTISGFGIGLYLCKEIIDRHQGTMRIESEPGKGSTFYFTLPVIV